MSSELSPEHERVARECSDKIKKYIGREIIVEGCFYDNEDDVIESKN